MIQDPALAPEADLEAQARSLVDEWKLRQAATQIVDAWKQRGGAEPAAAPAEEVTSGWAERFGLGAAETFLGAPGAAVEGLGVLFGSEGMQEAGKAIQPEFMSPAERDTTAANLGSVLGSGASFMIPGGAAGVGAKALGAGAKLATAARAGTVATQATLSAMPEAYYSAKANGATDEKAWWAALASAGGQGLLEIGGPQGKLLDNLADAFAFGNKVTGGIGKTLLVSSAQEAVEEGVQSVWGDTVAQRLFDVAPDEPWGEILGKAAAAMPYGAFGGAVLGGAAVAASRLGGRKDTPETGTQEEAPQPVYSPLERDATPEESAALERWKADRKATRAEFVERPEAEEAVALARKTGATVLFVDDDAAGDAAIEGMEVGRNLIILPAKADPATALLATATHESVHTLPEGPRAKLVDDLTAVFPKEAKALAERYKARAADAGKKVGGETLKEESAADLAKALAPVVRRVMTDRATAVRVMGQRPGLMIRVLDTVRGAFGATKIADRMQKELDTLAEVRDEIAAGIDPRKRIAAAIRIVKAYDGIKAEMSVPIRIRKKQEAKKNAGASVAQEPVQAPTVREVRGDDAPVDPGISAFKAKPVQEKAPEPKAKTKTLQQSLDERSVSARSRAEEKLARAQAIENRPRVTKKSRRRAERLRNQAKMLNEGAASMEAQSKSLAWKYRDPNEQKSPGDRVRLEDGREGTVAASYENGALRVRVQRPPGRGESAEDAARVMHDYVTVQASDVLRVEAARQEKPQAKADPVTKEASASAPAPARVEKPVVLTASKEAIAKKFRLLSKRQTHYMGHKGDFFGKNADWLAANLDLRGAATIYDMYAGGGTYGLTYAASGIAPDLKRVVINEVDNVRRQKFDLARKHGADMLDPWDTSPLLIELRNTIDRLVEGNDSTSPAALAIDTITGSGPASGAYEQYLPLRARYQSLSMDEKAALLAVRDVMFSGRTADVSKLFENARQDANNVQYLVKAAERRGIKVDVVSMDAIGPEAIRMVQGDGRSFVVLDPPYHGTASGNYSAGGKRYDFKSDEFLQMNLAAAKEMSKGNAVLYNNSATGLVQSSALAAFGPSMETRVWARKKVGAAPAQQEFLGVIDNGQGKGSGSRGVVGAGSSSSGSGTSGGNGGVLAASGGNGRGQTATGSGGGSVRDGGGGSAEVRYSLSRKLDELGFYSRLDELAEKLPEKMSGQSALSKLKAQANAEELEWSGVLDFLKDRPQVTRAEILEHLEKHGVKIHERVLSEDDPDSNDGSTKFDSYTLPGGKNYRELLLTLPSNRPRLADFKTRAEYDAALKAANESGASDFQSNHFDEPNIVAHMRVNDRKAGDVRAASPNDPFLADITRRIMLAVPGTKQPEHLGSGAPGIADYKGLITRQEAELWSRALGMRNDYSHGPDSRILFVEEIQSDWHQKGRELGYVGVDADQPYSDEAMRAISGKIVKATTGDDYAPGIIHTTQKQRDFAESEGYITKDEADQVREYLAWYHNQLPNADRVPNAPFKDTWSTLAMKRLLSHAASNGYDAVAWTTGAQQIDRYNESMRQNVDKIVVTPTQIDTGWAVSGYYETEEDARAVMQRTLRRDPRSPALRVVETSSDDDAADAPWAIEVQLNDAPELEPKVYIKASKKGQERFGAEVPVHGTTRLHGHNSSLEDVVGKEIASKIRAAPGEAHTFEGEGLAIGGKGMQSFYDVALPAIAKKLTKQEPEKIQIATGRNKSESVHAVRVPDTAKEGFARFSIRSDIEKEVQKVAQGLGREGYQLANAGTTLPERGLRAAVRSMMAPEYVPDTETESRVQRILNDPQARTDVLAAGISGEPLNTEQTVALDRMARAQAANAWIAGSEEDMGMAQATEVAYQQQRTEQARTMGTGLLRDAVQTPMERAMRLLLTPSRKVQRKLAKAETWQARRAILREEAKKVMQVRYALAERGFDPRLITDDYFKDPEFRSTWARAVADAKGGSPADWYISWRRASMLSAPITAIRNLSGNAAYTGYDRVLRLAADSIVPGSKTETGDVAEYVKVLLATFPEAWSNARDAYRDFYVKGTEGTSLDDKANLQGGKIRTAVESVGIRVNVGTDAFFKTILGAAEIRLRSRQMARAKGGVAEDYEHDPDVLKLAKADMERALFLDRDKLTRAIVLARDWADEAFAGIPVGSTIVPFASTPTQLVRRSGEALLGPAAALWRKEEKGGTALLGLATWAAMIWAASLFDDDDGMPLLTGSRDWGGEGEFQGRTAPAYSMRIGDSYYSYQQIQPLSTALAAIVDGYRKGTPMESIGSFVKAAKDQSFFRSIEIVWDAVQGVAQGERGLNRAGQVARDLLWTPMIPNVIRAPVRAADEVRRKELGDPLEQRDFAYAALPIAALGPPLKHDLWGRPVQKEGGTWVARVFGAMPMTQAVEHVERVDALLGKYYSTQEKPSYFNAPETYVTRNKQRIDWTEEEYSTLTREAGTRALERIRPWVAEKDTLTKGEVEYIGKVISATRAQVANELLQARNPE